MEGTHCARCGKKFTGSYESIQTIMPGHTNLQPTCRDDRTCFLEEMFQSVFISKKMRKVQEINKRYASF